ncbi:hypothetical protein BCR37DRAFT_20020 [Protomyces lactucae-debilis]|uniref:Ubiquitin carboxyl-terminal hydrolase n=1 Tax=Protomyces lactucae-debilis TaxID=2754530 RepID=A0A1Y2FZC4_PROLT|nr:uncharacterized protein BCR37DRAFT_20020 [Protomyces lactucae-debilis]ORY87985.1 hypothetical protein BCR37DRAFT_20020 [Protomyces lactucae-debilis]
MVHDPNQLLSLLSLCAAAAALSLFVLAPYLSAIGSLPKGPTIPGLRNWGNWCFCNSVLQSLSSLPTLKVWLNEHVDEQASAEEQIEEEKAESPMSLTQTLLGLLRLLSIEGSPKTLSSSPLVSALERVQRVCISRDQQDAQEFLHLVLESLAAEQNRLSHQVSILQMAHAAKEAGRAYIALPFEGILETTSTCTQCGFNPSKQQTPFLEWTVLPKQQRLMTLESCLAEMLQTERIDEYSCAWCAVAQLARQAQTPAQEAHANALKQQLEKDPSCDLPGPLPRVCRVLHRSSSIVSLPQILAIHINRSIFDAYATRNAVAIEFPEKLDPAAVAGHDFKSKDQVYQLRSFVTHKGSHNRGHYIAFRKRGSQWYMISDETIRIVATEQALAGFRESVFLLFYEKVDLATQAARKKKKRKQKKGGDKGEESQTVVSSEEMDAVSKI